MLEDLDAGETQEWVDALDPVLAYEGAERAFHLLDEVVAEVARKGAPVPYGTTTPYPNTTPPGKEERHPGDRAVGSVAAGVIVDDRGCAGIVGSDAGELIAEAALAVEMGADAGTSG